MRLCEFLEQKNLCRNTHLTNWLHPLKELVDGTVRDSVVISTEPFTDWKQFKYTSQIFDWKMIFEKDELLLLIKTPTNQKLEKLTPGTSLYLICTNGKGVHTFEAVLKNTETKHLNLDIYLANPQNFKSLERREFYRLSVQIPTVFRLLKYKKFDLSFSDKEGKGFLSDISAGGLLFKSNLTLPLEAVVEFSFRLPQEGFFVLNGKTVRTCQQNGETYYGVQFIEIDDITRGKINRFVYAGELRAQKESW